MKIRTAAHEFYHAHRSGETSGCVFATFVGEWPKKCVQGKHPVALNMFLGNSTRFKGQFIFSAYIQSVSFIVSPRTAALPHGNPISAGTSCHRQSAQGHGNKTSCILLGLSVEYVREMRKCITDNCGQNHEGGAQPGR